MWALPGPVFSETLPGRTEAMRVEKSALRMVQMPGYSSSGLSISSGLDTAWSIPQRISILPIGEQTGLVTAFEDEKGETVILSAERKEGYGGQDLYVLFREKDGTWSKPKNLGPDLNTYEEEFAPWLSEDGKTLYFTSGGHPGYGGWDLYRSERITQTWTKWSEPENLGPAINTAGDEGWYYPFKDDRAYLASTDSLRGHFDLYGLRLPVDPASLPVVRLSGHIRNKKTGEILGGDLLLRAIKGDTLRKLVEAPDGYFHSLVKYGRGYQMYGIVPGYFPITDTLDLRAVDRFRELSKDVFVAPVEVGEVIRLDKVYFARAEAALLRESFEELDRLVALMKAIPSLEIEIHGHTDNLGELGELQILSELRAERVMGYLVDHGIAATRMVARGFGGSLPVADNRNPDTRPLNRRVEFVIIRR